MRDYLDSKPAQTHPLGVRDCWPVTGPIYDVPEPDIKPVRSLTFWQRLVANTVKTPENAERGPVHSPIWY
jgi:hypothetical protein